MSTIGWGECPYCARQYRVLSDGTIKAHRAGPFWCEGGLGFPVGGTVVLDQR